MARINVESGALRLRNRLRNQGLEVSKARDAATQGGHLMKVLARNHIDLVLDVGAHHGGFGRLLRQNGYSGPIVSFEPSTANVQVLKNECGADAKWVYRQEALGSVDGEADLQVMTQSTFSSFHRPTGWATQRFGSRVEVAETERVPVRRLDDLWESIAGSARSVFLKIDTQGHDLDVLAGATEHLSLVPVVQTEVSVNAVYEGTPSLIDSLQALDRYGYDLSNMFPVTIEPDMRSVELDCVAIRRPADQG